MKRKLPVESESHLRLNMELSASSVSVVTLLLSAFVHITPHRSERIVPRIVPSKLQLLDYTSLTVNCEGFFSNKTQWNVVRKVSGNTSPCNSSITVGPCIISMVYPSDSGEYWCQSEDRQWRSESVQITVTAGGVVLESPVRPVMVGDTVTLRCITKEKASTEFSFYKDGVEIKSSSDGEMTIHNISESDQGRYKCSQGKQFSGENLLQVKAVLLQSPDRPVMEDTNVTLVCTDKMAALNHTTVFYKDGVDVGDSSSGRLTLTVSKSDEGVYKCSSSEGRESEEQWLSVTTGSVTSSVPAVSTPTASSLVGLIVLPLLLFVVWFIYKKYKGRTVSSRSETYAAAMKPKCGNQACASEPEDAVLYSMIEDVGPVLRHGTEEVMYSTVSKPRPHTIGNPGADCGAGPQGALYSTVNKKKKKRAASDTGDVYSVVVKNKGAKSTASRQEMAAPETLYDQIR